MYPGMSWAIWAGVREAEFAASHALCPSASCCNCRVTTDINSSCGMCMTPCRKMEGGPSKNLLDTRGLRAGKGREGTYQMEEWEWMGEVLQGLTNRWAL